MDLASFASQALITAHEERLTIMQLVSELDVAESDWRKSSFSGPNGGNCVEAAELPGGNFALRDSKDPEGPALVFTPGEWDAFKAGVHANEF